MSKPLANGRARLAQDLRQVVADADRLLETAAESGNDKLDELRERLVAHVADLRDELAELEGNALARARAAARATDAAVHTHPYGAMGLAAAVGLLVGLLLARR